MKLINKLALGALLTSISLGASAAAWTETKIRKIQVVPGSNSIQVYLKTPIDFDTCNNNTHGQKAPGISFRQSDLNFDQMYSALMAAQYSDTTLFVRNYGECVSNYWAISPTIQFELK